MSYTPAAGAALGNELCAGTVAKVGSTKRIQELHAHWLADDLPNLRDRTYDPFEISDEDYKELEGMAAMMKRVPWGARYLLPRRLRDRLGSLPDAPPEDSGLPPLRSLHKTAKRHG